MIMFKMNMDNTFDRTNTINVIKPLVEILNTGKNMDSSQILNSIVDTCTTLRKYE